jgi:hypothetical protein
MRPELGAPRIASYIYHSDSHEKMIQSTGTCYRRIVAADGHLGRLQKLLADNASRLPAEVVREAQLEINRTTEELRKADSSNKEIIEILRTPDQTLTSQQVQEELNRRASRHLLVSQEPH